jgi:Protein of unknown function (DUF1488)
VHFCGLTIGTTAMPLMRGEALGFDVDRMAFGFTMLNNEGETIRCQISGAAMDELAGARGTPTAGRQAQFTDLRERIEQIASRKFEQGSPLKGAVVRIFVKDIADVPHSSNSPNADRDKRAPRANVSDSSG